MKHASTQELPAAPTATTNCGQTAPAPSTCCKLTCFDRPRYFCGHLLTDEDLSLDQRYVIEKNKMYHRSLHGCGIVCGLRLTCDTRCCGRIIVDNGFAIDSCGNDLVVCDPIAVDVLAILRQKGYLVAPDPRNECEPPPPEEQCKTHQCFYVTICYNETQKEYTTPFVSTCGTAVTDCEATRVHEGVRFDVVSELPPKHSYIHELEERVKCCYRLFQKGPFAETLRNYANDLRELCRKDKGVVEKEEVIEEEVKITEKVTKKEVVVEEEVEIKEKEILILERYSHYHEIFCALRWYFLLYLKEHPDKYNCTLQKEVERLSLPHPSLCEKGRAVSYEEVREAFCKLLRLANQHVMSCVTGDMIFSCPEPCEASCIVLGTVEIENGELVRVCNCPRSYVWSFASIPQIFIAELLGGLACEADPESGEYSKEKRKICCREFELDCCDFINRFDICQETLHLPSTAVLRWVKKWWSSLRHAFSFDRRDVFASELFNGVPAEELERITRVLNIHIPQGEREKPAREKTPFERAQLLRLAQYGDTMELHREAGQIVSAEPAGELDQLRIHIKTLDVELRKVQGKNEALQKEFAALKGRQKEKG
jgi:hypothetical protein